MRLTGLREINSYNGLAAHTGKETYTGKELFKYDGNTTTLIAKKDRIFLFLKSLRFSFNL